jgi:hypothetical protein
MEKGRKKAMALCGAQKNRITEPPCREELAMRSLGRSRTSAA